MRAVRRAVRTFAAITMCLSAGTGFFHAVEAREAPPPRIIRVAAGMSIDQAVEMVERRFNAKVIRAETRDEGGRTVYALRLMNDSGRVWVVRVDAQSGAVL
jgi:uncharacterized membrane protein YkoI